MNSFIKKQTWIKNWSGNWRTTFASLYWAYTIGLKPYIGKNLDTNLLVCEKEVSSNYIAQKHLDDYCSYIANLVIKDNALANKWAADTIRTADDLFTVLTKLKQKKNLTSANLQELKRKFYIHIPPHFSMKKVIDYLPPKHQTKLAPRLIEARLKTENLFNAVDAALRAYSKLVAQQVKYPAALTNFLTFDELQAYFKNRRLPSLKTLRGRQQGMGIFYKGKNYILLTGKDYKELQKVLVNLKATELKGTVAYQGVAKGRVRIVFDPYKVRDFNKGDILVTGMTRPEFLPLMKKAGAFVTDAGGLLSHAAIVARELKKPCILGTQTATKVFKNGDIVEVNANNGIVKKL